MIGLKENVIIGKPIPAGTGMKRYRTIGLNTDSAFDDKDEITLSEDDEEILLTDDGFDEAEEVLDIDENETAE